MITLRTVSMRLRTNWQDPQIRRYVGLLFLGKAIGLFIVLTLITRWFLPAVLGAQAAPGASAAVTAPVLDPELVAITCPCYWVDPVGAFFIGIGGGLVVVWGIDLLEHLRIDDPIGAAPVHMIGGIWGTLSLGLFAAGRYGAATPTGRM